ncbi:hypothetical protein A0H81_04150 [Grifola frondosa]|uniref:Rab-GAP TBC domain-containing protein n=1 Tax=Grifola frondosa TaxID=5627 RepID=A0A1C7MLV4_GRIFR|nr:hypothetical protein A0H81_04150 [Grifola frondosa]
MRPGLSRVQQAQLRLTAQRLGQLQDKMESQAQITKRDIATLVQQGNVGLARAKAQKLMRDDTRGDLLQTMEMHVGVILGHLNDFDRSEAPSPVVLEAASSIVYAALQTESKDLHVVRELLIHRLGPDFARAAVNNKDDYVSTRVVRALSSPPPTALRLDQFLYSITQAHGVQWMPDLSPQQKVNMLSEMLDPQIMSVVDISRLRKLCSHGLPVDPPWLRPKVWRLLLGTLPPDKASWSSEARKQRDNYYDLVRRLLDPISSLPEPTTPLTPIDASLVDVSKELSYVPPNLLSTLEEEPEASPLCPLDDTAPDDIKITCAGNIDSRLRLIRASDSQETASSANMPEIRLDSTPEIRLDTTPEERVEKPLPGNLEISTDATPEISLSVPDSPSSSRSALSTTLLPSRPYSTAGAHHKHASALLRLLYIHSCLNPANRSPQVASLLVPIYAALVEEVDPLDEPHIEADAFWVFEAMVGEFSELEDQEYGNKWVQKLSERLRWADEELADDMQTKGLDPGLPHYSFRWLIPILTHTLPLPAVLMAWDALFARPMRERDNNPKLDYLIDICTSMLLSARGALLRLGRTNRISEDLWSNEIAAIPSTPLGARELEDAFVEGMSFLQQYRLEAVGGIEKVLQTAFDLASQREAATIPPKAGNAGLGARLRETVWKGISSLETHTEEELSEESTSEEEHIEPTKPSNPSDQPSTLTTRLATTVWRGITNQSAMDPEELSPSRTPSPLPSPLPPSSPAATPEVPPKDAAASNTASRGRSMIWGYAEKLKDSDAAATLAKVSTNWRVKALDAWSKRASSTLAPPPPSVGPSSSGQDSIRRASLGVPPSVKVVEDNKRGSLPMIDRSDAYSPPPRPAFFRPPRDSMLPAPRRTSLASPISRSGDASPVSDAGSAASQSSYRTSLSSFTLSDRSQPRTHNGPRPLLLNSSTLMTAGSSRSPIVSPSADAQWADSVRAKRPSMAHRGSQSSVSSLSPSDVRARRVDARSDSENGGSRIIPLHRKSPSPMARTPNARRTTSTSSTSPPRSHRRLPTDASSTAQESDDNQSVKGWGRADAPDSPPTVSPPPRTPDASAFVTDVRVKATESQRGSVVLTEPGDTNFPTPVSETKLARRSATISRLHRDENSDSSATEPSSRNTRLRSKRFPPRLASLRNKSSEHVASGHDTLAVDVSDETDNAKTPRAGSFDQDATSPVSPRSARRVRKVSGDGETRTRKISAEGRVRKISTEGRVRKVSAEHEGKHKRESAAVEGDDEGYNDLLSAYESEDNAV